MDGRWQQPCYCGTQTWNFPLLPSWMQQLWVQGDLATHILSCQFGEGRHLYHAAVNNIIKRALTCTCQDPFPARMTGLCKSDGNYPDGKSTMPWKSGVNTCRKSSWNAPATYTLHQSEYHYLPLAVEISSILSQAALDIIGELGQCLWPLENIAAVSISYHVHCCPGRTCRSSAGEHREWHQPKRSLLRLTIKLTYVCLNVPCCYTLSALLFFWKLWAIITECSSLGHFWPKNIHQNLNKICLCH